VQVDPRLHLVSRLIHCALQGLCTPVGAERQVAAGTLQGCQQSGWPRQLGSREVRLRRRWRQPCSSGQVPTPPDIRSVHSHSRVTLWKRTVHWNCNRVMV
jgi:hypothetical protein